MTTSTQIETWIDILEEPERDGAGPQRPAEEHAE